MFVLGIGKSVDRAELNQIASGPNNVFTVDSFRDLKDKVHEIKRGICIRGILCFCDEMIHSILFRKGKICNSLASERKDDILFFLTITTRQHNLDLLRSPSAQSYDRS